MGGLIGITKKKLETRALHRDNGKKMETTRV